MNITIECTECIKGLCHILTVVCSEFVQVVQIVLFAYSNLFILRSSRKIRPLFRVSSCLLLGVQRMLCRCHSGTPRLSCGQRHDPDRARGVGFDSEVADQSGPEQSASRLSGSSRMASTRIGCSIQQFTVNPSPCQLSINIVGFCPLFRLWDFVLWDSVLWDFVRRDFVLWDFVLWDSVRIPFGTSHESPPSEFNVNLRSLDFVNVIIYKQHDL